MAIPKAGEFWSASKRTVHLNEGWRFIVTNINEGPDGACFAFLSKEEADAKAAELNALDLAEASKLAPKMLEISFSPTARSRRVIRWTRFFEDCAEAAKTRAEVAVYVEYPGAHRIQMTVTESA